MVQAPSKTNPTARTEDLSSVTKVSDLLSGSSHSSLVDVANSSGDDDDFDTDEPVCVKLASEIVENSLG